MRFLTALFVLVGVGAVNASAQNVRTGEKAQPEQAELRIVAAKVQMLLIAPDGRKTGYDPRSKGTVGTIPKSRYDQDALLAYDTGAVDLNTTQTIDVRHPAEGRYRLVVSPGGAADGEEYEVHIHLYLRDGIDVKTARIAGTAKSGKVATYELSVDAAGVVVSEQPGRSRR